jgi:2-keto-4-pentenoate hydratase/2-oxohepta-3-ene-1,7-dioic acid hydratase in catechol pathway
MRLASVVRDGHPVAAVVESRGLAPIGSVLTEWPDPAPTDVMGWVEPERWRLLTEAVRRAGDEQFTDPAAETFTAPYRRPRKIWGIGLNYKDHAADLSESAPEQPASFIKGDHTIVGPDEPIVIPRQSSRTTVEAELGLIIGRTCRDVDEAEALDYVWGVTTILDQTAEDILRLNPRFLTRSKNFPTFFCFGPELVPLDEVLRTGPLETLEVSTIVNGTERRTNTVANMTHSPASLVSFHSKIMPLFPGDIISTGTPGAIVVGDGDVAEASIPRVSHLRTVVATQR